MTHAPPFTLSPHHTALRCLFVISLHRGVLLKPENFGGFSEQDTIGSVLRVMRETGLRGKLLRGGTWKKLVGLHYAYPFMAMQQGGNWVVVINTIDGADGRAVTILDPQTERDGARIVPFSEFAETWTGALIVCKLAQRLNEDNRSFGLRWFVPEILRYGNHLRDVAIAAIMSSLIAFGTPLMFQLLIDKVITHRSYQTLFAIMLIFGVLTIFDGLFNYTRHYLMLFVTSKIDARLAARTFHHLLSLPLSFFESTTAGVLIRHLQQTETIRHFLTGRLFQCLLDATAFPVLLILLLFYSAKLTFVALLFSAAIAGVIGIIVPVFRHHLEQLYQAEGARQAQLVESLHGIRTVKALAIESQRTNSWNDAVALGVRRRMTVGQMSAFANVATQSLEKAMQMTILALGALDVFDGRLSIGALIAFNMFCGRVTGPLVQVVGLINEYQESALAVKMLGTVMRHAPERPPNQPGMMPQLSGALEFDRVTFRYDGAAAAALDRVSFAVEPGQVIGIVGRSGSGKTTVTRLIQGIQTAQEGAIRIDNVDIRHIDLAHLRRSIGVVLQENFLFRGTIRDNIAAVRADATLEEVIEAARLAGADEFIERLPLAYQTMVEENGTNFSGGQRQRIAIARALLTRPRLLIFDEATSALDPESEAIVQNHLTDIARGRTLIIVSHRLTALTGADAILVLEHGQVVDFAPHRALLARCETYRRLWLQQTRNIL